MTELDEWQTRWAEQDRKLDASLRMNRQVLQAVLLGRVERALRRERWFAGLHLAGWVACLLALGNVAYGVIGEARFAIPAVMVGLYSIGMVHLLVRQMVMARGVDYGEPVAVIQRRLEGLRVLSIRTTQWAVLGGVVVWVPALIVALRAMGVDAYAHLSFAWMAANVALGLVLIPISLWTERRYGHRMGPRLRRMVLDLAGGNLNRAVAFLGSLAEFENEG